MNRPSWTLQELAERTAAALAGSAGPASRRVTDVPGERVIRYYTTLGLLDRPAAWSGRTALYGERHLLQLVAIKRLQGNGHSLASVQAELAGADDRTLRRIAAIRPTFWKARRPESEDSDGAAAPKAPAAAPPLAKAELVQPVDLADGLVLLVPTSAPLSAGTVSAVREASTPIVSILRKARP